jgi:hypothetical protein
LLAHDLDEVADAFGAESRLQQLALLSPKFSFAGHEAFAQNDFQAIVKWWMAIIAIVFLKDVANMSWSARTMSG